jgi:protein-S-isoprenylcysteine O-methyltransferase Ste14
MGRKLLALLFGLCTHALFAAAVSWMAGSLYCGMALGRGTLEGPWGLAADALLLAQFPLLHSLFLTSRGRSWLARLAPCGLGAELSTTLYAAVASLQVLAVFVLWTPSGRILWHPAGAARAVWTCAYALSWLLLGRAMFDAGLGLQTGSLGWLAVVRGRRPDYGCFPERGLFRHCRQPVYAAFALVTWTAPTWTPDRVALALVWTLYCALGPLLKERRYLGFYGDAFQRYRERVPYLVPALSLGRRRVRGPRTAGRGRARCGP